MTYYENNLGYYTDRHGGMLHRAVWSEHHGNIPHGWVVHHKDEDPGNNDIDNLECMPFVEHAKLHRGPKKTFICMECGMEYQKYANPNGNKYCSNACICRAYKRRRMAR